MSVAAQDTMSCLVAALSTDFVHARHGEAVCRYMPVWVDGSNTLQIGSFHVA